VIGGLDPPLRRAPARGVGTRADVHQPNHDRQPGQPAAAPASRRACPPDVESGRRPVIDSARRGPHGLPLGGPFALSRPPSATPVPRDGFRSFGRPGWRGSSRAPCRPSPRRRRLRRRPNMSGCPRRRGLPDACNVAEGGDDLLVLAGLHRDEHIGGSHAPTSSPRPMASLPSRRSTIPAPAAMARQHSGGDSATTTRLPRRHWTATGA
jgi:hypothetical protein